MAESAHIIPFTEFQKAKLEQGRQQRKDLVQKFLAVIVAYCPQDTTDYMIYKRLINLMIKNMNFQFPELDIMQISKREIPCLKYTNGTQMYVNIFGDVMIKIGESGMYRTYDIDQLEVMNYPEAVFFVPHVTAYPG